MKHKALIRLAIIIGIYIIVKILDSITGIDRGELTYALFGIDDALLLGVGTSLISGLGNMFGGSDDREPLTLEKLKSIGWKEMDTGKMKGDLARMVNARIQDRRRLATQKGEEAGINSPSVMFSNEKDLINAEQTGLANIDKMAEEEKRRIDNMLLNYNLGLEMTSTNTTPVEDFIEGGLAGANIGLGFSKLLPGGAGTGEIAGTPTTKNTIPTKTDAKTDLNIGGDPLTDEMISDYFGFNKKRYSPLIPLIVD